MPLDDSAIYELRSATRVVGTPASGRRRRWWDEVLAPIYASGLVRENLDQLSNIVQDHAGASGAGDVSFEDVWFNSETREPVPNDVLDAFAFVVVNLILDNVAGGYNSLLTAYPTAARSAHTSLVDGWLASGELTDEQVQDIRINLDRYDPFGTIDRASEIVDALLLSDADRTASEEAGTAGLAAEHVPPRGSYITGVDAPVCAETQEEPEINRTGCIPDVDAPVPDWSTQETPFLNQKNCTYYITIKTDEDCPNAEQLPRIISDYMPEAVLKLLNFLGKELRPYPDPQGINNRNEYNIIRRYVLDTESYEFEKFPNVKIKLLYKIPFGLMKALDLPPKDNTAEGSPSGSGVILEAFNLVDKLNLLQQRLGGLALAQADLWNTQGTKILKEGTSWEINLQNESNDIDSLKSSIGKVLSANNMRLAADSLETTPSSNLEKEEELLVVTELQFFYDEKYNLTGLLVRERGAPFIRANLSVLLDTDGLQNPTNISYLANLDSITLSSISGVTEFLARYHYPRVRAQVFPKVDLPPIPDSSQDTVLLQSMMNELVDAADSFAKRFANYSCMTGDQLKERNKQLGTAFAEMEEILSLENIRNIAADDPLISNLARTIENITSSMPPPNPTKEDKTVAIVWEKIFNKMSACGLLKLIIKSVEFIVKNDVCGISPEKALVAAIGGVLKNEIPEVLEEMFEGLPPQLRDSVRARYTSRVNTFLSEMGSNEGATFPWEYARELGTTATREENGNNLYSATGTPYVPQESSELWEDDSTRAAFDAGRGGMPYDRTSSAEEEAYWTGQSQALEEGAAGTPGVREAFEAGRSGESFQPLSEEQTNAYWDGQLQGLNDIEQTASESEIQQRPANVEGTQSDIANFANGILADSFKLLMDAFVEALKEELGLEELLEATKDIPAIGVLIRSVPQIGKCVINNNVAVTDKKGNPISLSAIQNTLEGAAGQLDICKLTGGNKALTLPNIEVAMQSLNINSIWSAFVNALVDTLKQLLVRVVIQVLMAVIKKAIQALLGELCGSQSDPSGRLGQTQPPSSTPLTAGFSPQANNLLLGDDPNQGDLYSVFSEAYPPRDPSCAYEPGRRDVVTESVNRLMSSISGITDEELSLAGGASATTFINSLGESLNRSQLLDLLSGTATDSTIQIVLDVVRETFRSYQSVLQDASTVRDFFLSLGTSIPTGFLSDAREMLDSLQTDNLTIAESLCDEPPSSALEQALRDECGDAITEEQIQQQVDHFEQRIQSIIEDLTKNMADGFDSTMEDVVTKALDGAIPKTDPGTIKMVEQTVDAMLDPFYMTYIDDLTKPLQPNFNAGFLNMILSNKDGVPQKGQLNQLKFFTNLQSLGGALNSLLPEGARTVAETGAAVIDPLGALFGELAAAGAKELFRARLPTGIATPLRVSLEEGLQARMNNSVITLEFYYGAGTTPIKTFEIRYNFANGSFVYQPYINTLGAIPVPRPDGVIEFNSTSTNVALQRANNLIYFGSLSLEDIVEANTGQSIEARLEPFYDPAGSGIINNDVALDLGGALVFKYMMEDGFMQPPGSGPSYTMQYIQTRDLLERFRVSVLSNFANSVSSNTRCFEYGDYNFDTFTDADINIVSKTPSQYLLDRGFNLVYLNDGRVFMKPPEKRGWLGIKDRLIPPAFESFCCPPQKEIFDIEGIKDRTLESFENTVDDPRLQMNPKTVNEPPYAKILSRMNLAAIEGVIVTTIRAYVVEAMLKGAATFTKFKTDSFGDLMADYIANKMREGLRNQGPFPGAPTWPPGSPIESDKMYAYWYEFLEQCVQVYSRRIKAGTTAVTPEVDLAMLDLQVIVDSYEQPQRGAMKEIRAAMAVRIATDPLLAPLQPALPFIIASLNLKNYRRFARVSSISNSEAPAMIILKNLIKDEFLKISDIIEDVFATPPGGWVGDVNRDFLNSAYSADGRGIFDISSNPTGTRGVVAPRIVETGGGFDYEVDGSYANISDFTSDQVLLESYAVGTLTAEGQSFFGAAVLNNVPIGIRELAAIIKSKALSSGEGVLGLVTVTSNDISQYFSSLRYGIRLAYVPSPTTTSNDDVSNLFSWMTTQLGFTHTGLDGTSDVESPGRFAIPLVRSSACEEPLVGTIGQFMSAAEQYAAVPESASISHSGYFKWSLLADKMINSQEYSLMFGYNVPIESLLSLVGVYNSEAFLSSIGDPEYDAWNPLVSLSLLSTGAGVGPPPPVPPPPGFPLWNRRMFPKLKRDLKKMFNELYNSNDFLYEEESRGRRGRERANRERRATDINDWLSGLSPNVRDLIIEDDPMREDCRLGGISDDPGTTTGTSSGEDGYTWVTTFEDTSDEVEHDDTDDGTADGSAGSELSDDDVSGAPAASEAEAAERIALVERMGEYANDAFAQELLNEILGGFASGASWAADGGKNWENPAGAGGAWDLDSFSTEAFTGLEISALEVDLAADIAAAAGGVADMTNKEFNDFIFSNFAPGDQAAARDVMEGLRDMPAADLNAMGDFFLLDVGMMSGGTY
jgi:hypothetical protein